MKVLKWLDEHFEETLLVLLLIIISVIEMLQVLCRKIDFIPTFSWTDEVNRFCWIWTVFLSIPYTLRHMNMLRVSLLIDKLPSLARNIWNILIDLLSATVYGLLFFYSINNINGRIANNELSPALEWPMWIIYLSMLIGFGLGALRGLQVAIIHCIHIKDKTLSTTEQTIADAKEEAEIGKKAEAGYSEGGTK